MTIAAKSVVLNAVFTDVHVTVVIALFLAAVLLLSLATFLASGARCRQYGQPYLGSFRGGVIQTLGEIRRIFPPKSGGVSKFLPQRTAISGCVRHVRSILRLQSRGLRRRSLPHSRRPAQKWPEARLQPRGSGTRGSILWRLILRVWPCPRRYLQR